MAKATKRIAVLFVAFLSAILMALFVMPTTFGTPKTAHAAETEIVFALGANDSATHKDGSAAKTTYSETVAGYTLSITNGNKMYPSSYDAKGNSCIKLGSSSAVGGFSFTVPDDVTSVIIEVAKYKTNTTKISVNGTSYTINGASNNGVYDTITVDTSATKTVSFTTVSGGVRAMVNTITYIVESAEPDEPACEHANTKYVYENGKHTEICSDCDATVTEATSCSVASYTYVRNENKHTGTGVCTVCGNTVEITENCTLEYTYVSNDNKTHNTTSTCSVCNESVTTANVACSFGDAVVEGTVATYTCEDCGYSYTEEVATWTVFFRVPDGVASVAEMKAVQGEPITLPKAADYAEDKTFVGWTTDEYKQSTTKPEIFEAGTDYKPEEDVILYALYTFTEGTGAWTLVTNEGSLSVNDKIVIAASGSNVALSTTQNGNNRGQVVIEKNDKTSTITFGEDVQTITLEAGTKDGTFAFNVGTGYLYAASGSSNYLRTQEKNDDNGSWLIEIDADGVATIKAQGTNARNWLRWNSSSALFACYASGQNDVSIYEMDGSVYYTTSFKTICEHTNTTEETIDATCTETGLTVVTCEDCEAEVSETVIPAKGHAYVDNFCSVCGEQDPATITYEEYYYLSINNKYANEKDGNYYKLVDFTPGGEIELQYVFYFVKNGETYDMYNMTYGLFGSEITLEKQENGYVHITNKEDKILSVNTSYSKYTRMGFYASSNNYPCDILLTKVDALSANIHSASLTVGQDLSMNYYVAMSDVFSTAQMRFTYLEETTLVDGVKQDDGRYKFTFTGILPQCMGDNIKAELIFNDNVIAVQEEYSVKTYAQNNLKKEGSSTELKQLLTDLLYYGAASQNYKDHNTENLVTAGVEGMLEASTATPTSSDQTLTKNPDISEYPAYIKSAGVLFDNVNKLYIKLSTTENVTVKVNGTEIAVESTIVYTDGIYATEFDTVYTIELYHGDVLMQTLTYSINSYAYKMKDHTDMGELALALYRYGVSADAYAASIA